MHTKIETYSTILLRIETINQFFITKYFIIILVEILKKVGRSIMLETQHGSSDADNCPLVVLLFIPLGWERRQLPPMQQLCFCTHPNSTTRSCLYQSNANIVWRICDNMLGLNLVSRNNHCIFVSCWTILVDWLRHCNRCHSNWTLIEGLIDLPKKSIKISTLEKVRFKVEGHWNDTRQWTALSQIGRTNMKVEGFFKILFWFQFGPLSLAFYLPHSFVLTVHLNLT